MGSLRVKLLILLILALMLLGGCNAMCLYASNQNPWPWYTEYSCGMADWLP